MSGPVSAAVGAQMIVVMIIFAIAIVIDRFGSIVEFFGGWIS